MTERDVNLELHGVFSIPEARQQIVEVLRKTGMMVMSKEIRGHLLIVGIPGEGQILNEHALEVWTGIVDTLEVTLQTARECRGELLHAVERGALSTKGSA